MEKGILSSVAVGNSKGDRCAGNCYNCPEVRGLEPEQWPQAWKGEDSDVSGVSEPQWMGRYMEDGGDREGKLLSPFWTAWGEDEERQRATN